MYKLILFLIILFDAVFLPNFLLAQCQVDAGEDLIACITNANQEDTIRLDGTLLSGDIVSYSWSAKKFSDGTDVTNQLFRETDRLDPSTQDFYTEYITVFLTGITSDNQTCIDSMSLIFSIWDYGFANTTRTKDSEDTIQIFGAAFSDLPVSYEWSPNYNISDITTEYPQVWNDTTVTYFSNIMDTLRCIETNDSYTSIVSTTSVDEISKIYDFSIYPNPASAVINIESDEKLNHVKLMTVDGRQLLTKSDDAQIDVSDVPSGTYIIKIVFDDGTIRSDHIVINR